MSAPDKNLGKRTLNKKNRQEYVVMWNRARMVHEIPSPGTTKLKNWVTRMQK
jgi:hypothetical protein